MMRLACGLRAEDLILYKDGVLRGGKGELVAAHLGVCPVCRRWMADFEHMGRLIREASPPIDDPAARARIHTLIERETLRGRRSAWPRPLLVVALALALVLLVALIAPTPVSGARSGVGRFFRIVDRGAQRSVLVGGVTPTAAPRPTPQPLSPEGLAALPFSPRMPTDLPLGLRLADGQIARGTRLGLRYRNDRGLVLALIQERTQDIHSTLTTSGGRLVTIGGVEVMVQPDPVPGSVVVLTWEDDGVLYALSADEVPEGPLSFEEARQIVEALLVGR